MPQKSLFLYLKYNGYYHIVLVLGILRSDSVTYVYTFLDYFPLQLLQDIDYSFLCTP